MGISVILALVTLFANATVFGAEDKTLTAPFPNVTIDSHADNFFCSASLGTTLSGRSKEYPLASSQLRSSLPLGVVAKAFQATDRLVLEISKDKLYMFSRDEFESGKTTRDFPLDIIENTETNLVAIATGLVKPKGATFVTLNRKTGIGSWTSVMSIGLLSDSPRIEAIYLTCGARKD